MQPEATLPGTGRQAALSGWAGALAGLAVALSCLVVLGLRDWVEMAHQWWDISTYNHILLIPFIVAGLVRLRMSELRRQAPVGWWPGLVLLAVGITGWAVGRWAGINLVSQASCVLMVQAAIFGVLGTRASLVLLFPLAYLSFLVPFGDEIVPLLQFITARMAIALTHLSGVPATLDGIFINTPAGLFEVAEACSGVKFLVAMVALGVLVANVCFASPMRRAVWMASCVVVPVVANGIRAWGTIFIAQSHGVEFAAGFDHIVYGWVFFALVMGGMLLASWRYFDRHPDDPAVEAGWFGSSPVIAALDRFNIPAWQAVAAVVGMALFSQAAMSASSLVR